MKEKYVVAQNHDKTQATVTTLKEYHKRKIHHRDVDGRPMKIIHQFEADSWDEAMTEYHRFMGFEPYKPMED